MSWQLGELGVVLFTDLCRVGLSLVIELGSSRVVKREHHLVRLGYWNQRNDQNYQIRKNSQDTANDRQATTNVARQAF